MNGTFDMARSLVGDIVQGAAQFAEKVDVAVSPPFVYLNAVSDMIGESSTVALGAQDCSEHSSGAYTGEVSSRMLAEIGCEFVIVGHSERRRYHNESDDEVGRKANAVISQNINAIACVGEMLEERQSECTKSVIDRQLRAILDAVDESEMSGLLIAYEPVWAIGTGLTASTDQIQEVHHWIREGLREVSADAADSCRILYGGSVNAENAAKILEQPDVDGCLVGGASLGSEQFLKICSAAV